MSFLHFLASFFGYVGVLFLYIQVVFGTRHIFSLFTKDTVLMNKLHKYLGKYGTCFIFLHPVFEMVYRKSNILWLFLPSFSFSRETYISLGRFALFLTIVIYVTSAIVRQKIKWRPWKYVHLVAYPTLLLTFFHVPHIGSLFETYSVISYVWYTLFFVFIVASLYRLSLFAGLFKEKGTIMSSQVKEGNVLVVSVSLPLALSKPAIGQHIYLQYKSFSGEHPFTVMEYDDERRVVTFGMRMGGAFVTAVSLMKIGSEIRLDGPYGTFTQEAQNNNPKVIIAGGVGVTPFVRLVSLYGAGTTFFYCNKTTRDAFRRDVIKSKVSSYVDVVEDAEGQNDPSVVQGRISADIIKAQVIDIKSTTFFVCGSPPFIEIVKRMLVAAGANKKIIYYEELGF